MKDDTDTLLVLVCMTVLGSHIALYLYLKISHRLMAITSTASMSTIPHRRMVTLEGIAETQFALKIRTRLGNLKLGMML